MEGLNTLAVRQKLKMLNAPKYWSFFLGDHRHDYLLGEPDGAFRSQAVSPIFRDMCLSWPLKAIGPRLLGGRSPGYSREAL